MDSLRFRVWCDGDYTLTPYCQIDMNGDVWLLGENESGVDFTNITSKCTVERCTGFSNKNRKLIYKGDRVQFGSYTGTVMFGTYSVDNCGGENAVLGFYIEWDDPKCLYRKDMGYWSKEEIEIIGTIHEKEHK